MLKDFLPAELDLIDVEEGGSATPDVAASSYHEWDRPVIPVFPAVAVAIGRGRVVEVHAAGFGNRLHALYEVEVKAHVQIDTATDDALRLQNLCFRYGMGIERVLGHKKDQLQTVADPAAFVLECVPTDLRWGPEAAQESGQQTRTATVAFDVRKAEAI